MIAAHVTRIIGEGPAFPTASSSGMTLRDWFAGQALAGLLAADASGETSHAYAAAQSYRRADAMLAERAKAATP